MLKVGGEDIPADLRTGHVRRRYEKPKKGREFSLQGKSTLARSGLTRPPGLGVGAKAAAHAHRNRSWDKNGQRIQSCQEYAYEQLYDAMRFTDAMGACAGDRTCEMDVAYRPDVPGIADRVLRRKDGAKLLAQVPVLGDAKLPKNEMFLLGVAHARDPVLDKDKPAQDPEADAINAAIAKGNRWYALGCKGKSCGGRKFRDEWEFHRTLRMRNKGVSAAEFAEYERRKAKFRELYDAWQASAGRGKWLLDAPMRRGARTKTKAKLVKPIDLVTRDPIERMGVMREAIGRHADSARKLRPGWTPAPAAVGGAAQPTASWIGGSSVPTAVMAAPPPSDSRRSKPEPKSNRCSPSHWKTPDDAAIADLFRAGPASCRIADFLRKEWRRMKKGQKSCLDLDDDDCDWSPEMFHGRFVASFSYAVEQQRYENVCELWTGGSIDASNLTNAEKYISAMEKKVGAARTVLAPYRAQKIDVKGQSMWRLGGSWVDAEAVGDKDWFAAGYDYDVGWRVQPVDLADDKICDLEGSAHAYFGVDAWIIRNEISIIDGQARGEANHQGTDTNRIQTKLSVLGIEVPGATLDEPFTTVWAPDEPWLEYVQLPEGVKPSFHFQAGPIPITGSAWGSLFFGADMSATAKLQAAGQCNPKKIQFGIDGEFAPMIGVNGYAQLGVGVPGLSAGIRGALNLVSVELPVDVGLDAKKVVVEGQSVPALVFDAGIGLALSTLSGHISLYIEYLVGSDEWELFRWSGLSHRMELMDPKLRAELPLVGWPK